jgi:hypothetical protein
MHIPSARTRRDMDAAAELRAAGATWETIGESLGRHAFVMTRWARVYRDDWQRLLNDAQDRALRQRDAEARAKLRGLLRHESSRIRLATADQLLRQRLAEKAAETPADLRAARAAFLADLDQMSDAELHEFVAEFLQKTPLLSAPGTAP